MRYLSAHGIATVAFNFRTFAPSESPPQTIAQHLEPDLQAGLDAAHERGANKVFLLGASFGGAASLAYAPQLRGLAGLINLSGELRLPNWNLDGIAAVPKLTVPLLVIASRYDGYLDAADARLLDRPRRVEGQTARPLHRRLPRVVDSRRGAVRPARARRDPRLAATRRWCLTPEVSDTCSIRQPQPPRHARRRGHRAVRRPG